MVFSNLSTAFISAERIKGNCEETFNLNLKPCFLVVALTSFVPCYKFNMNRWMKSNKATLSFKHFSGGCYVSK